MSLTHSYNVGYRGLAVIGSINYTDENNTIATLNKDDCSVMLCTGGNVGVSQDPIMSGGVWGAGEGNISPIAYAWNYLTLDCSMNVELTNARNYWHNFINGGYYILYPDGNNGYSGTGYRTTTSVDASEGSALSGSINFKDTGGGFNGGNTITNKNMGTSQNYPGTESSGGGEGGENEEEKAYPLELAGDTLVPYWRTCITTSSTSKDDEGKDVETETALGDIISWNVSSNRDVQFLKCCKMQNTSPISADYVVMGEITGDASYTTFGIKGSEQYHKQHKNLRFKLNIGKYEKQFGTSAQYYSNIVGVKIPIAICNSSSTSMSTGSSYVTTEYSYNAIGDTTTCGVDFF